MSTTKGRLSGGGCPECDIEPFARNHYFTGKLLVERDFTDEQRYVIDKLRHHHQRLHGQGVVCGLKVVPHEAQECRDRYLIIEPGTAIDCCGREVRITEREYVDITTFPEVGTLFENDDGQDHVLQIAVRYRECPTEEIPVLYDECGCDETRCAPNRILESYAVEIRIDPKITQAEQPAGDCCELLWSDLDSCPDCDADHHGVVLATIEGFRPGDRMEPLAEVAPDEPGVAAIDNRKGRRLLPSTQKLAEAIRCLCEREAGGGGDVAGIDRVDATFVECDSTHVGARLVKEGAKTILKLTIPRGCDGRDGTDGTPGRDGINGKDGVGLEKDLTRIHAISWHHNNRKTLYDDEIQYGRLAAVRSNVEGIPGGAGVVIEFTAKVLTKNIDSEHVFQLLTRTAVPESNLRVPLSCWCNLPGVVAPVKVEERSAGLITKASVIPDGESDAIAFILDARYAKLLEAHPLWVRLRGDFILDAENKRAIDAEFARADFPSGDRPRGSEHGVQGGLFESWFHLGHPPVRVNRDDGKVIAAALPGIGETIAKRIVEARKRRRFEQPADLLKIDGITENLLKEIENLIAFD